MKTLSVVEGSADAPHVNTCGYRRPVAAPVTVRFTAFFALLVCALFLTPAARAQWQTISYNLHGGWNSIYLHGDANYTSLETLFANNPEIISVWRWNPNPNQVQFESSPLIPLNGTPEWSIWTRGATTNTLGSMPGQAAYLVECSGAVTDNYTLALTQKVLPPRSTWVRNGANLLGFPSRDDAGYSPFSNYFATFPAATAANSKVYKYVGGPLGAANPIQVFNVASEKLDRTQAYWFEAAIVGNFYAPLEVSPSNLDGLIYGRNGSLITVRVRNRTANTVNLKVAPEISATHPPGQDPITDKVPLTYRTFNTTTLSYQFAAFDTFLPVVIGPQSSVELSFGVDRSKITGATNALYASLLRFTDGDNLMDVYLPVSARVTSLSGLWVGDVAVTNVGSKLYSGEYICAVTRTVTTGAAPVVTTVDSPAGAHLSLNNTLTPSSLPLGTGGTLTYQWKRRNLTLPATDPNRDTLLSGQTAPTFVLGENAAQASGLFGTTTKRPFPLRVILHMDDTGSVRLLSQVYLGKLDAPSNPFGLATEERFLKPEDKAKARRLISAHLPLDQVFGGTTSIALGQTVNFPVRLPYNASTNPFVHSYHPDHDNRSPRFDADAGDGVESPTIERTLSFAFAPTPPAGSSAQGWGSTVLGGTYTETVTGIHKAPLQVTGTFELRRVSELGSISIQIN